MDQYSGCTTQTFCHGDTNWIKFFSLLLIYNKFSLHVEKILLREITPLPNVIENHYEFIRWSWRANQVSFDKFSMPSFWQSKWD